MYYAYFFLFQRIHIEIHIINYFYIIFIHNIYFDIRAPRRGEVVRNEPPSKSFLRSKKWVLSEAKNSGVSAVPTVTSVASCVTPSYALSFFPWAYWHILVPNAYRSVKIRLRICYRGHGKSSKRGLLRVTFAPFCYKSSKNCGHENYCKSTLVT